MRLHPYTLLAATAPFALADVKFTIPAAGTIVSPLSFSVTWADSGVLPPLSQLTPQTLQLMVGGNAADGSDSLALATLTVAAGSDAATGSISVSLASPLKNGFYLKMTSEATQGGTVYNFSPRFSLNGMTGNTATACPQCITALTQLAGSTVGPATVNQASQNAPDVALPPVNDALYAVPYHLQTGLTRYRPMQPIPPTKITAQNPKPLNPTSPFVIATAFLPTASIVTTFEQTNTYITSRVPNTIAAQSMPTGDMAKFLARWKD